MSHHLRGSMHQIKDKNTNLRNKISSMCGVGFVEEIITGETVHSTIVVSLRYTVHRRHILLEILVRLFHMPMHH